ncbi:HAD family hydrolase [Salipaludibacillus sp. LMS25]|jgi:phosphoglycolate phosphatase/pyrophosphatase PpaX|uniref:HAD family hydrolase n=1 Tax=Salipaludibacillus sp. LMS25 TaxID=2924031 RepID=UPI0020D09242|nr:HAD family hydrolase [Salipaludibacillus sp. LMS25]UTR16541.1 HAD family hydrolase [Salipaludibacillus sp. LMS25]
MKAIIFDFDGTLANTLPICYYAFQNVFIKFDNKDLSSGEIKAMFGPSETGIIKENLLNSNKEQAIELYYEKYAEHHNTLVKPNKKINELIRYLKSKGLKIGIVTGKAKRSLDISLKALQMENIFDVIITGDDVIRPKPDPEGINKALSLLDIKNNEAMFIGDSDADIHAGVQWLPDYQTSAFSLEPHSSFNSVYEFIDFLNKGGPYEL